MDLTTILMVVGFIAVFLLAVGISIYRFVKFILVAKQFGETVVKAKAEGKTEDEVMEKIEESMLAQRGKF